MASEPAEDPSQVLDAREIDEEPFGEIMDAIADLDRGASLLLINSFEPEPLYNVLTSRGFAYETRRVADDEWHVEITHA